MADGRTGHFYDNCLVLNPRKATLGDLIWLLFSDLGGERDFIKSSLKEGRFKRRWLVFVSFLVQKPLLRLKEPFARFSGHLEDWLNLVSINGGFISLLPKYLKGNLLRPERESARYRSVIGNLDPRVDLDGSKEEGSEDYNAMISMMASKLAYENKDCIQYVLETHWKMDFVKYCSCWNVYLEQETTQAFVFENKLTAPSTIFVAFRGTQPFNTEDWCTDIDLSWYELKGQGRIHGGFMKALGLQRLGWPKDIDPKNPEETGRDFAYYLIRQILRDKIRENPEAKFMITGHSLGGALAVLFVAVLALHEEEEILERVEGVFTFGQPRVGDQQFGNFMERLLERYGVKYRRFVYCNDIVPRLPFHDNTMMFKHFGRCIYYDSLYRKHVIEEEPNKNYFNLLWAIPNMLNAVWELVRSFIMPWYKGPAYKEGWFLKLLRLAGLLIPGLSAHSPQDYVNLTLMGIESSSDHVHQD